MDWIEKYGDRILGFKRDGEFFVWLSIHNLYAVIVSSIYSQLGDGSYILPLVPL
jgi:hypothetical protein